MKRQVAFEYEGRSCTGAAKWSGDTLVSESAGRFEEASAALWDRMRRPR